MVLSSHPDNGLKGVCSSFPELRQSKYQAEMLSKSTGYKEPEPFSFWRRVGYFWLDKNHPRSHGVGNEGKTATLNQRPIIFRSLCPMQEAQQEQHTLASELSYLVSWKCHPESRASQPSVTFPWLLRLPKLVSIRVEATAEGPWVWLHRESPDRPHIQSLGQQELQTWQWKGPPAS